MRRAAFIALLAAAGCSSGSTPGSVSLPGPNSLAVAGRALLVANTAADEVRALNLTTSPRTFERAPNPIYPLSMPTAPFPRALAAFTAVDPDGTLVQAPFAFALSTAGAQVTLISAGSLATLGSFPVPDTTLAIAVTRPPTPTSDERLVLATAQGGQGVLYSATFAATLQADPSPIATTEPTVALQLGASSPQVLVSSPNDSDVVVLGDRLVGDDGAGRSGGVVVCNLSAGTIIRVAVGGPVMALAFDARGDRLFGLLDSDACAGSCGGMFAVDMTNPAAPSFVGSADVPGTGLGLAAGADELVTLPLTTATTVTVNPLVMVSSSDGSIYAYDGQAVRELDSGQVGAPTPSATFDYRQDPPDAVHVTDPSNGAEIGIVGPVRDEDLWFTFEGALVRSDTGAVAGAVVSDAVDFAAQGVQPGDLVEFAGGCTSATGSVAAVAVGSLTLSADPGCGAALVGYDVRPPKTIIVEGTRSGFVARLAPGAQGVTVGSFSIFLGSFGSSPCSTDSDCTAAPAGTCLGSVCDYRDTSFVYTISNGIAPFSIPVAGTITGIDMPGAAAYDPVNKLFYIAFAGGNSVEEIDPVAMRNAETDVGVTTFQ